MPSRTKHPEKPAVAADVDDFLIKTSDFESMTVEISLNNTTTRTEVRKGAVIHLVEVLDRGMILEVPERTCAQGHNLVLSIRVTLPEHKPHEFKATAKVDTREALPEGTGDRIQVSLTQFNEKDWLSFTGQFSRRQDEIMEFFAAAKGLA